MADRTVEEVVEDLYLNRGWSVKEMADYLNVRPIDILNFLKQKQKDWLFRRKLKKECKKCKHLDIIKEPVSNEEKLETCYIYSCKKDFFADEQYLLDNGRMCESCCEKYNTEEYKKLLDFNYFEE